jgi:catechol 2,3-dioxygenase-like lactoylglutathione lyase family enzyme
MIKNIHHIGINVRDFDAMLRFYQDAFGFKVLGEELDIGAKKATEIAGGTARPRSSAMRIIMMQAGNCFLEIMGNPDLPPRAEGAAAGYAQLCMDVDDIDAEFARLKGIGMAFGSAAPVDFGHVKAVTGLDPEGNAIELVQTMRDWDCVLADLLPARA